MFNLLKKAILKTIRLLFYFILSLVSIRKLQFVIVTGADSSHFKSLCQLLNSLIKYESKTPIIVYDLGLSDYENDYLNYSYPSVEIRLFDYSQYPSYLNIKVNAGEYAWKPVIISNISNEFKCTVCWLDAGNLVTKRLVKVRKLTKVFGFFSLQTSGVISDWTHPKTLKYLKIPNNILNKRNLTGGCVSINYNNPKARALVDQWKKCALIKECIAPEGSGRHNHRQDQSVLSVLAYKIGIANKLSIAHKFGIAHKFSDNFNEIKIHQDID